MQVKSIKPEFLCRQWKGDKVLQSPNLTVDPNQEWSYSMPWIRRSFLRNGLLFSFFHLGEKEWTNLFRERDIYPLHSKIKKKKIYYYLFHPQGYSRQRWRHFKQIGGMDQYDEYVRLCHRHPRCPPQLIHRRFITWRALERMQCPSRHRWLLYVHTRPQPRDLEIELGIRGIRVKKIRKSRMRIKSTRIYKIGKIRVAFSYFFFLGFNGTTRTCQILPACVLPTGNTVPTTYSISKLPA